MNKKITILLALLVVIKKLIFNGLANKRPQLPPQSIVALVLTSNIGDMIFVTSVFRALKEKYPACRLTVVGSKKNKITLTGNPDIDEYIINYGNIWALINAIKTTKADYGFTVASGSLDIICLFWPGLKPLLVLM